VYAPVPLFVTGDSVPNDMTSEQYISSFHHDSYDTMKNQGWAVSGYGAVAFAKTDYIGLNGYNIELFEDRKNYEDTDLAVRFFSCDLLVIRKKVANFVHLPHGAQTGSWANNVEGDETSGPCIANVSALTAETLQTMRSLRGAGSTR